MSVDAIVNRKDLGKNYAEKKKMRLSFTLHARITVAIPQALLGAPLIPEFLSLLAVEKQVLKNKPIILKPHVMREGKKKPKTFPAEHPTSKSPPKLRLQQ